MQFTKRSVPLLSGSLMLVMTAATLVGCSGSKPAPAPSSSAPASVQPTEKALVPPPKAFSPTMNAADGIAALESEGYNVEINWGGGRQDQNLALCRIGNVDGLRGSGATKPGTSVYVTVIC